MAHLDVTRIKGWHAHVYFDAVSRDDAWSFRDVVTARFGNTVEIGRFHERPVGPHPQWSFQIASSGSVFVFDWSTLPSIVKVPILGVGLGVG